MHKCYLCRQFAKWEVKLHMSWPHVDNHTLNRAYFSCKVTLCCIAYVHRCRPVCTFKYMLSQFYLSLSAVASQAVGSSPCRWKVWEKTKPLEWKLHRACEKNTRTLQGAAAASPWQRWGERESVGSQNVKVTQSIHVLIIPLPYERNITSLVSMMKIHIRSFQPVYFSSEHKELAIRVKTRKWTAYLLINQTQVHYFRVLHGNTISDFV